MADGTIQQGNRHHIADADTEVVHAPATEGDLVGADRRSPVVDHGSIHVSEKLLEAHEREVGTGSQPSIAFDADRADTWHRLEPGPGVRLLLLVADVADLDVPRRPVTVRVQAATPTVAASATPTTAEPSAKSPARLELVIAHPATPGGGNDADIGDDPVPGGVTLNRHPPGQPHRDRAGILVDARPAESPDEVARSAGHTDDRHRRRYPARGNAALSGDVELVDPIRRYHELIADADSQAVGELLVDDNFFDHIRIGETTTHHDRATE